MVKDNGVLLNNPLPCIFATNIMSYLFFKTFELDKVLAIIIVSTFFVMIYFYYDFFITVIMGLMFLFFMVNIINFYSYNIKINEEVRIVELNKYNLIGEIKGRKVILDVESTNLKSGDRIIAIGTFEKDIDKNKGVIGKFTIAKYEMLDKDFMFKLYRLREKIYCKISEKIGARKAGIISSVAFGDKEYLDLDDKEIMKNIGISHIMAVSGLHMAIVYSLLRLVLGGKVALFISIFYVLFTGAPPSTIRAYIMILIMEGGKVFNRNYNSLSAWALAGIIILIYRPYEVYNLGFILSFLATLGIILFNSMLNKVLYKLPNVIRGVVTTTLAAQVFIVPILIFYFNEMSFNFILGNIIVVPLMNVLIVLGNVYLVTNYIEFIGNFILYICHHLVLFIDNIIDAISIVMLDTVYINNYIIYIYLAIMITWYFYKKGYKSFKYFPIIIFMYVLILAYNPVPTIRYIKEGAISVGYRGQCINIQTKDTVDKEKIKAISMTNTIYKNFKEIKIADNIVLKKQGKNYIMIVDENKYMLLVNYDKTSEEYDIIDFINGDIQEVIILNDKIIRR